MLLPAIDPDARRRRLTALVNTAWLARTEPGLFIIEDEQWIDASTIDGVRGIPARKSAIIDSLTRNRRKAWVA